MKLKERLDNYLYDKEYRIIIKENSVNVINYEEIIDFTLNKISLKYKNKVIIINGYNLSIVKMLQDELLIIGTISQIIIN